MVDCNFGTIVERDMDRLLLEAVATDPVFARLLVDKTDLKGQPFEVISVELSLSDSDGESDITIVMKIGDRKYGFLIEDKIDAPAMDKQHERYKKRGDTAVRNKKYQEYRVFIYCAEKYRERNSDAQFYEHFLSYEECKRYFDTKDDSISKIRSQQFAQAIHKARKTIQTEVNEKANAFFRKYKDYQEKHFPELVLVTSQKSNGYWPHYRTHFGNHIYLYHKISSGFVDLTFNKAKLSDLEQIAVWARKHGIPSVRAVTTSGSAALRIKVPDLDMQNSFDDYDEGTIRECFEAIEELIDLADVAHSMSQLNEKAKKK